MDKFSYLSQADVSYIDGLYKKYQENPQQVDVTWQKFFEGFDFSRQRFGEEAPGDAVSIKETNVRTLIYAYRSFGHLKSDTNPVRRRRDHKVVLEPAQFHLTDADLNMPFNVAKEIGMERASPLKDIIDRLKRAYLGPVGFEYMHIRNDTVRSWFHKQCEDYFLNFSLNHEEKRLILSKLNEASVFENFLHTKFLGQKRFSLEGGENTIPALQFIINKSAAMGVREAVIGMAHRGRLNVLTNILGKTYEQVFSEFEGLAVPDQTMGDGDVKYHLGFSSIINTPSGNKAYVKLSPNPSHLETVGAIMLGYTRGKIDEEYGHDAKKALSILIHGDAAIAGQGLVYELTQMSGLPGYTTGGAIHFVINNQVGFTTDYDDARSSIYCTDVAKIIDAPVLHVNGDDAEAVAFCANLAVEYRQTFDKDIFIDLLCYRRHGHNESDEPKFTQPLLYNLIAKHPNPREIYVKKLIERGEVDAALAEEMEANFRNQLQERLDEVKQKPLPYKPQKMEKAWEKMRMATPKDFEQSPETGISEKMIERVAQAITYIPEDFNPLKQIEKLIKDRKTAFFDTKILGWAEAELLAYGSLLADGVGVRMSGQDVKRGTFSHRHAYIFDSENNTPYCGLNHIGGDAKKLLMYNSLLSEYGVLGFEYGYAMSTPNSLVIWEAQFGDFANGAQVIIDQFLSSSESKWQLMNGLVMLLPHGYEGQGPEHSNARPERFLQLAGENNMIVCCPTTPANFFHLLRRQTTWPFRKPCVVFSPKSMLRHPAVVSPLTDFYKTTRFSEIIEEPVENAKEIKRIVLCSGKIYYDLMAEKVQAKNRSVAIIRVEQLYPWPENQIQNVFKKYKNAEIVWVQEEPANMGFCSFVNRYLPGIKLISRKVSASPATGFSKAHKSEQEAIVKKTFQ